MSKCTDSVRVKRIGCGREWFGLGESHCNLCHGHFSADSTSEVHWLEPKGKEPIHLDPATVVWGSNSKYAGKPRLELDDSPNGKIWRHAYYGVVREYPK